MSRTSHIAHCNVIRPRLISAILLFCCLVSTGPLWAETWKPLCPVGSSCNGTYVTGVAEESYQYPFLLTTVATIYTNPLITDQGVLLRHEPVANPWICPYCSIFLNYVHWSPQGMEEVSGLTSSNVSDFYAVRLENGNVLAFRTWVQSTWNEGDESSSTSSFKGEEWFSIKDNSPKLTLPPTVLGNRVYVGISHNGGTLVYSSSDNGETWTFKETDVRMGGDRYNLLTNPERNGLWAISSEFQHQPGSLWESYDHGANWSQVDDGSFPANTMRVVHDPHRAWTSYALTDHGLYLSHHRGTHWQPTALTQPVYSLISVDMPESNSRALVAGTSSGVVISHDNGETWSDLANGLLAGRYTVVLSNGQLLASGENGYFTCDGLDCAGRAQVFPPEDGEDLIEVVEYYNTILGHYFITGSDSEKAWLGQIDAGSGWQRTGETFLAWEPGQSYGFSDVCRFYGSVFPGPNSHFYSNTALECRMLQELQEDIPQGGAGWKFEGWAMSVYPRYPSDVGPCPSDAIPVYRAYNNGYALGKDSNHRYMTDTALVAEMQAKGWIDEGIAFCAPVE